MIFKQAQQVLDATKTQTRRPIKKYGQTLTPNDLHTEHSWPFPPTVIENGRVKWMVGHTYAVQPGRGKRSIGRILLLEIRRERLQEISLEDIEAEGITTPEEFARIWGEAITHSWLEVAYERLKKGDLRNAFRYMWRSIYKKPHRWEDNPEVWVLEFERVED